MIILGKNPGIVQQNLNTVEATHDKYMFATAMKEANISAKIKNMPPIAQDSTNRDSDIDSFSSSSASALENEDTCILESDGFTYLAGWIAKKVHQKYPYLIRIN